MFRKILLVLVAAILTFAFAVFMHLKAYKSAVVAEKTTPEMRFLYAKHIGPYNDVNQLIEKVFDWAVHHNLSCAKTFGEYLDNPRTTDMRVLRSHVGCVLEDGENPKDTGPYKIEIRPPERSVWAEFDGSPAIGPFKVYPKMQQFAKEHGLKVSDSTIEIYTIHGDEDMTTDYYMAIK